MRFSLLQNKFKEQKWKKNLKRNFFKLKVKNEKQNHAALKLNREVVGEF